MKWVLTCGLAHADFLGPISGPLGFLRESPGTCVALLLRVGAAALPGGDLLGRQSPPSPAEVPNSTSSWVMPKPASRPDPAGLRTHSCCPERASGTTEEAGATVAHQHCWGPSFQRVVPPPTSLTDWSAAPCLRSSLPPPSTRVPMTTALGSSFPAWTISQPPPGCHHSLSVHPPHGSFQPAERASWELSAR